MNVLFRLFDQLLIRVIGWTGVQVYGGLGLPARY